jgi:hypothetical protein
MSIAEFDITLQNRIFNKFNKLSSKGKLEYSKLVDSDSLRAKYEAAKTGASSIITESSLNTLITQLNDSIEDDTIRLATETLLNSIDFNHFIQFIKTSDYYTKRLQEVSEEEFKLSSVPQGTLRDLFLDYIGLQLITFNLNPGLERDVYDHISKNVQSGHLAGVFTLRLKQALFLDTTSTGEGYRDFKLNLGDGVNKDSVNTLEKIMKVILDADYLTSNIVNKEYIFAEATKSVLGTRPHLEVELQYSKDNEEAGRRLSAAGTQLTNLINTIASKQKGDLDATNVFRNLVISLKPLTDLVIAKAAELEKLPSGKELANLITADARSLNVLANSLINTQGSPSIVESIELNIRNILKTGKTLPAVVTKLSKSNKKSSKDKQLEEVNKTLKKVSSALQKAKTEINKQNKLSGKATSTSIKTASTSRSLTSLQSLINQHLQNVISANMGSGTEKRILNYRTGRFAESAKVESMSQSRQGMITAFYRYMKNPYQTFEPGFRQGSPKTRDPKLLISQSIREIAATRVGNQLRAQAL